MVLQIDDIDITDDFVNENNILKGANENFFNSYQVGEVILNVLASKPDHVSQIDASTGKQTTFAEMRELSVRCGLWLKKQGIGPGDIVTLCTHNHSDTYIPFLATFYVGATYNAWNHETTLIPGRHLMKTIQPKIIFACERVAPVLLEAAQLEKVDTKIVVFGEHPGLQSIREVTGAQSAEEVRSFRPAQISSPKDVGLIILSSGSTGFPKGVVHSYDHIFKIALSFNTRRLTGIALWYSTCYWITGFAFTLVNMLSGGTRIIHTSTTHEDICQVIERYKVERIFLTPILVAYLCKSNILQKYKLQSLKLVVTGGSKISQHILLQLKASLPHVLILSVYGMSETGRCITAQTKKCKNNYSVGYVASGTQIKIADLETGKALGPNENGELCVRAVTTMLGYFKNPQATKETFDDEGWLRTGDKAYYDANGEIVITDRLKDVMKYHNHQVSPAEIEEVLLAHPDVNEVSVVPIPHETAGEHAVAFVKKVSNSRVTEEELVQLSSTLGEIKKLWGGVKFLDELPKTASGKINRPLLKEMAKAMAEK